MTDKNITPEEARKILLNFIKTKEYKQYKKQQDLFYEIAHKLRSTRQRKHLTQKKLAEKMGVKQPTIARIEKTGRLSTDLLSKFCIATEVKLDFVAN